MPMDLEARVERMQARGLDGRARSNVGSGFLMRIFNTKEQLQKVMAEKNKKQVSQPTTNPK